MNGRKVSISTRLRIVRLREFRRTMGAASTQNITSKTGKVNPT